MTLALAVGQVDQTADFIDGPTFMKLTAGVVFLTLITQRLRRKWWTTLDIREGADDAHDDDPRGGCRAVGRPGTACKQEPSLQSARWDVVNTLQRLHSPYDGCVWSVSRTSTSSTRHS